MTKCTSENCKNPYLPYTKEYFYGRWTTYANGNKVFKLNRECKECSRGRARKSVLNRHNEYLEYQKNWNEKNKIDRQPVRRNWRNRMIDERMEYQKEWQHKNPEKTKKYRSERSKKNHKITPQEWDNCRLYFNYRCAYCDKTWEQNKIETKKDLHREHVVHDGSDMLDNCVPSCRDCNSSKHDKLLEDWYNESNPIYSSERINKILEWTNEDYINHITE